MVVTVNGDNQGKTTGDVEVHLKRSISSINKTTFHFLGCIKRKIGLTIVNVFVSYGWSPTKIEEDASLGRSQNSGKISYAQQIIIIREFHTGTGLVFGKSRCPGYLNIIRGAMIMVCVLL